MLESLHGRTEICCMQILQDWGENRYWANGRLSPVSESLSRLAVLFPRPTAPVWRWIAPPSSPCLCVLSVRVWGAGVPDGDLGLPPGPGGLWGGKWGAGSGNHQSLMIPHSLVPSAASGFDLVWYQKLPACFCLRPPLLTIAHSAMCCVLLVVPSFPRAYAFVMPKICGIVNMAPLLLST